MPQHTKIQTGSVRQTYLMSKPNQVITIRLSNIGLMPSVVKQERLFCGRSADYHEIESSQESFYA
jgi:hypothetical protein